MTFEPEARAAWHKHPFGQVLAGEEHWHGASPTNAMTHIAIQREPDDKAADWREKPSDKQCQARRGGAVTATPHEEEAITNTAPP